MYFQSVCSLARQNGQLFLRKEPGGRWCVGRAWVLRGHQWNKPCVLSSCPRLRLWCGTACVSHALAPSQPDMCNPAGKKHSNKGEWGGYRHTVMDNVAVDQVTPPKPYWLIIEWDPVGSEAEGLSERSLTDGHKSLKESMMRIIKIPNYKSHLWDLWRLSIIQPEILKNSSSIIMILWESTHIYSVF